MRDFLLKMYQTTSIRKNYNYEEIFFLSPVKRLQLVEYQKNKLILGQFLKELIVSYVRQKLFEQLICY